MKKFRNNILIVIGAWGICGCLILISGFAFVALFLSLYLPTTPPWWTKIRWDSLNPVFIALLISSVLLAVGAWLDNLE
jgi:H+/Cl- antiporter ClcA